MPVDFTVVVSMSVLFFGVEFNLFVSTLGGYRVVRDEQDGSAIAGEGRKVFQDSIRVFSIKIARRLVCQN